MTRVEFIELHFLISELIIVTQKAAKTNNTFNRYNKASINFLNTLPKHLITLEQGLSIIALSRSNNFSEKNNNIQLIQLELAA